MSPTEPYALPRQSSGGNEPEEAAMLPGDFSALLQQLGSPDVWIRLPAPLPPSGEIRTGRELLAFLEFYQTRLLAPLELPAITRAHSLAARGHLRELLALDRELEAIPWLPPFASASRRIGRAQLERLRPLRDERIVRRYLAAVESGDVAGWHTLVYGITLAVYSKALRQGLLLYARTALSGLALAAGPPSGLDRPARVEILETCYALLPAAIELTLATCAEKGALACAL